MKMQSASLWVFRFLGLFLGLFLGASATAGCGGVAAVRGDWEAELSGSLSPDCHNLDHIGYGLHHDIYLNGRQAATREGSGALGRPPVHAGSRHGE